MGLHAFTKITINDSTLFRLIMAGIFKAAGIVKAYFA
tara:strand:- start:8879 stop:8989 length:111 start_codon:yes stop_codon:yes gene_type:complete